LVAVETTDLHATRIALVAARRLADVTADLGAAAPALSRQPSTARAHVYRERGRGRD
jgi:hypothetical protein